MAAPAFCMAGGCLLLSTTNEDCSVRARLIDAAGPLMGIAVALLAWLGARIVRAPNLHVFLTLVFAFAMFWNIGYLVKSGLGGGGDWHFAVAGLEPAALWHGAMAVAGIVLYAAAMRALVAIWSEGGTMPSARFALVSLLAAAALSAAGGAFDPQGSARAWTDALPASLASFGLVLVGLRRPAGVDVAFSLPWIAAGIAAAAMFVMVLGPGWRPG